MESFRKWLFRPKRDDKSLLAQFFYADEALNNIASELDSFDGRKDPGRCTTLVNQLRHSQDKVLTITNAIMDVLLGEERANREFRVKFPEDVLQENLAGQLWFGAECLAAGSSIMNKEFESAAMRPLAKAVTKSLETVRNLLRDTCLRNNTPNGPIRLDSNELVTELLLESLKIFDRVFADFELAYVSAMVPVKSTQEYELLELIGVLYSETLRRALDMKLLQQETVDDCDPALMFTIPRLAIVSGLLVFPAGPLSIDRPVDEMSSMFRPFRTLLKKIRELLWTLDKRELYRLEKLLCDNEEINDMTAFDDTDVSDKFIEQFYPNLENSYGDCQRLNQQRSAVRAAMHMVDEEKPTSSLLVQDDLPSTSGYLIPNAIAHDIIVASISDSQPTNDFSPPDRDSLEVISVAAATLSSILTTTELGKKPPDCERPSLSSELQQQQLENGVKTELDSPDDSGVCSLDRSPSLEECRCPNTKCQRGHSKSRRKPEDATLSTATVTPVTNTATLATRKRKETKSAKVDEDSSSVGSSSDTSSFNSTCGDDEEIAMAMRAAQIANRNEVRAKYRSSEDLLHRLFVCIAGVADQLQTNFASDLRNILKAVFLINATADSTSTTTTTTSTTNSSSTQSADTSQCVDSTNCNNPEAVEYRPSAGDVIESDEFSVDPNLLAQEALFDANVYYQLEGEQQTPGAHAPEEEEENEEGEEGPPKWIPDVEAPKCMSCGMNFTVVKRRHHCRNCGKVFCARCSANSVPLPKFGHHKPVRVCNRCFIYNLTPFAL